MSQLKKLAGQTMLYGVSNILAKMLNYLLTPLLSYLLIDNAGQVANGNMAIIYATMTFFNIFFAYGMETTYFRFSSTEGVSKKSLFQTTLTSLIITTVVLTTLFLLNRESLASYMVLDHVVYINLMVFIIAIDTIAVIPFAKLRQEERPLKYAMVKVLGIFSTIVLTVWFVAYSPSFVKSHSDNWYSHFVSGFSTTGLLLLANLIGSLVTFLLLFKEWRIFKFQFDYLLWKKIIKYSLPFVIIGLGGMINEVIDRIMLSRLFPGTPDEAKAVTATYNFSYKLAIFITLFIQAFKMAAEPFFFNQSKEKNAPETYAKVMHWFVITLCIAFLFTALYLDVFKYFIGPQYRYGMGVVPVLLAANVCLGIYYNLAVWYKVSDKLIYGMGITFFGAALTLGINYYFIPVYGMYACAWATFICYFSMMVLSYYFGQQHYKIPYNLKSIGTYILATSICFVSEQLVIYSTPSITIRLIIASLLFFGFLFFVKKKESIKWSMIKLK